MPLAAGVTSTGTSHTKSGLVCQDACHFEFSKTGEVFVAAVADGLGSAQNSSEGANLAVRAAVKTALDTSEELDFEHTSKVQSVLIDAFAAARKAIRAVTHPTKRKFQTFGTTLIVCIASSRGIAIGHIGDGGVVALANDEVKTISKPSRGEYANSVQPLTGRNALSKIRFVILDVSAQGVVIFTDGLQNLLLKHATLDPFPGFFNKFLPLARAIKTPNELHQGIRELLESSEINSRTDDDKTLLVAFFS